jgi:hypothetical protein
MRRQEHDQAQQDQPTWFDQQEQVGQAQERDGGREAQETFRHTTHSPSRSSRTRSDAFQETQLHVLLILIPTWSGLSEVAVSPQHYLSVSQADLSSPPTNPPTQPTNGTNHEPLSPHPNEPQSYQ